MDVYILDSLLRRIDVVDQYESFIWTDRWYELGDFELVVDASWKNQQRLRNDALLAINDSDHIMIIQSVLMKGDDNASRMMLTVKGKSLEYILEDRVAKASLDPLTIFPRWYLSGAPGYLARSIVKEICVNGMLNASDIIPMLIVPLVQGQAIWPLDTIPESNVPIKMELEPGTLLAAVQQICKANSLGFGILRNPDKPELYFEVWTGSDRTAGNSAGLSPVVFSSNLETLENTTELTSKETYKNVAYVLSDKGGAIVHGNGDGSNRMGLSRRVLLVVIDNLRENNSENYMSTADLLQKRGREALASHRQIHALDGEISKSSYKYRKDYFLGDLVEMQNANDVKKIMRVTEQIFVSDAEGDRSYPTLASDDPQNV